jgi:hypothetical protein
MSSQPEKDFLKLVYVDCLHNKKYVYETIKSEIQQELSFLSLEDLKAGQAKCLEELLNADLIIVKEQYISEIKKIAASEQEIIRVNIQLDMQLLTKIALKPRNSLILLVCQEEIESEEMKKNLQESCISHVKYESVGLESIQKNSQILEQAEVVCVSKEVEYYVRQYSSQPSNIMVFNFRLNEANLAVLKTRLSAIQLAKTSNHWL